jgi:biopolymer transport protein ExbD
VVKLSNRGIELQQSLMQPQSLTQSQLLTRLQTYWQDSPQGFVLLEPQENLPYQTLMDVLLPLQKMGGNRVSLVIPTSEKSLKKSPQKSSESSEKPEQSTPPENGNAP